MHCCLIFLFHFFWRAKFCSGCFRQVFFILETKKVVTGCVRLVVVLCSNDFVGICLGRLSVGHLRWALSWGGCLNRFDCIFSSNKKIINYTSRATLLQKIVCSGGKCSYKFTSTLYAINLVSPNVFVVLLGWMCINFFEEFYNVIYMWLKFINLLWTKKVFPSLENCSISTFGCFLPWCQSVCADGESLCVLMYPSWCIIWDTYPFGLFLVIVNDCYWWWLVLLQVLSYETCNPLHMPLHMPKTLEPCKKNMPCVMSKALRCVADHTSKTTTFFIFYFL